jgi:hypothetical protein
MQQGAGENFIGPYSTEGKFEGEEMMTHAVNHNRIFGKEERDGGSAVTMMSDTQNRLCPFIQKPFDDCYCTSTSSLYAEATIYYCGGHYRACEIYAKNVKEKGNHG